MNRQEKSLVVRQMRDAGLSYNAVMERLGCTRTECYVLARYDVRHAVEMDCKTCGEAWVELKMPSNKEVFHRCAQCATVLWAAKIARDARAGA